MYRLTRSGGVATIVSPASVVLLALSATGGLNISSLAVNAPKGHTAKLSLSGGNASTFNIGIMSEADFAIMKVSIGFKPRRQRARWALP